MGTMGEEAGLVRGEKVYLCGFIGGRRVVWDGLRQRV